MENTEHCIQFQGKRISTDEEGYLECQDDWSEDLARFIAQGEGLHVTQEHWEVILFLRKYYAEYHTSPMIRILTKELSQKLGPSKGSQQYLYELFPGGPAKQACKIAGLPKPTGCI